MQILIEMAITIADTVVLKFHGLFELISDVTFWFVNEEVKIGVEAFVATWFTV